MNSRLAKKIRKQVYGPDGATRLREYFAQMPKGYQPGMIVKQIQELIAKERKLTRFTGSNPGQIFADKKRQLYQLRKKMVREAKGT